MSKFTKTKPEAWQEWKELCAIQICGEDVQDNLCSYGGKVVSQLWRKFSPEVAQPFESNRQRWQFFESYMHATSGKTGKRWKDWLFEKAESSSDDLVTVLEKEAHACMRTTVIQFCSSEGHLKAHLARVPLTALDAPLSTATDSHVTFGDTRAGNPWEEPSQAAAWNELRDIAHKEAADLFLTLDHKGKTALLADCLEISLDDAHVQNLAGAKKTALYDRLVKIHAKAEAQLRGTYLAEDARTIESLVALTREELHEASILWGKSEKSAEPLFTLYSNRMNS